MRRRGAAATLVLLLAAAAGASVPELPDLSAVDPAVRAQLVAERERVVASVAGRSSTPERAEAYGRLGRLLHAYDLLPSAEEAYRAALAEQPKAPRWRYYLGDVLFRSGRLDEAASTFAALAVDCPGDAAIHLRWGEVELARGEVETAAGAFRAALRLEPTCEAARFGLGEAARAVGDFEGAAEHFRGVLAAQPEAAQVHYPLAQVLLRLGRTEEARTHLERVAARAVKVGGRPTCPQPLDEELRGLTTGVGALLLRGMQANFAGRPDVAVAEYEAALVLAPDDPMVRHGLAGAHLALGRAAVAEGREDEALGHFDAAVATAPDDRAARLGRALLRAKRRDLPGAAADLAPLADAPGPDPAERLQLGTLLTVVGDAARADRLLAALAADPAAPAPIRARAALQHGALAESRGDRAAAAQRYRAALELDPSLGAAKAALARLGG